MTEAITKPT